LSRGVANGAASQAAESEGRQGGKVDILNGGEKRNLSKQNLNYWDKKREI